jgi:hypothetical protein
MYRDAPTLGPGYPDILSNNPYETVSAAVSALSQHCERDATEEDPGRDQRDAEVLYDDLRGRLQDDIQSDSEHGGQ